MFGSQAPASTENGKLRNYTQKNVSILSCCLKLLSTTEDGKKEKEEHEKRRRRNEV